MAFNPTQNFRSDKLSELKDEDLLQDIDCWEDFIDQDLFDDLQPPQLQDPHHHSEAFQLSEAYSSQPSYHFLEQVPDSPFQTRAPVLCNAMEDSLTQITKPFFDPENESQECFDANIEQCIDVSPDLGNHLHSVKLQPLETRQLSELPQHLQHLSTQFLLHNLQQPSQQTLQQPQLFQQQILPEKFVNVPQQLPLQRPPTVDEVKGVYPFNYSTPKYGKSPKENQAAGNGSSSDSVTQNVSNLQIGNSPSAEFSTNPSGDSPLNHSGGSSIPSGSPLLPENDAQQNLRGSLSKRPVRNLAVQRRYRERQKAKYEEALIRIQELEMMLNARNNGQFIEDPKIARLEKAMEKQEEEMIKMKATIDELQRVVSEKDRQLATFTSLLQSTLGGLSVPQSGPSSHSFVPILPHPPQQGYLQYIPSGVNNLAPNSQTPVNNNGAPQLYALPMNTNQMLFTPRVPLPPLTRNTSPPTSGTRRKGKQGKGGSKKAKK